MKKWIIFLMALWSAFSASAQTQIKAKGLTWNESYVFELCNGFEMEFYAKNNDLRRTSQINTYYQKNGENFMVQFVSEGVGNGMETIIDKKNEVAVQMMGTGGNATPFYNVGGFKYPADAELKKLELIPTEETKNIMGYECKKYTYVFKKIFGEVWITNQISLPNDLGVFRACKMAALHNTLSVPGFVMEMTTEDAKGGKTLMKTVELKKAEKRTIDLKRVEMNTAINKVNYFSF
jgi:GLPGLI family protein